MSSLEKHDAGLDSAPRRPVRFRLYAGRFLARDHRVCRTRARAPRTVGLSLEEAFRELTRDPDAGLAFQFTRLFHEHAERVMEASTVIYEDAHLVLRRLRRPMSELGIVSTKLHHRLGLVAHAEHGSTMTAQDGTEQGLRSIAAGGNVQ